MPALRSCEPAGEADELIHRTRGHHHRILHLGTMHAPLCRASGGIQDDTGVHVFDPTLTFPQVRRGHATQPGGPNTSGKRYDRISIHHHGDVLPLREVEDRMNRFQRLLMCAQSRADDDGLHPLPLEMRSEIGSRDAEVRWSPSGSTSGMREVGQAAREEAPLGMAT